MQGELQKSQQKVQQLDEKRLMLEQEKIQLDYQVNWLKANTDKKGKVATARAIELLELVGINEPEKRLKQYPFELSGGMRQRAALLRTYMCNNQIALLDEPFSALDTLTKTTMHNWYLGIMEQIKLSTLFITHDIDEAILLSDRIYILGSNGTIAECITIDKEHVRKKDLLLSESFLKYKKAILNAIGE